MKHQVMDNLKNQKEDLTKNKCLKIKELRLEANQKNETEEKEEFKWMKQN